MTIADNIQRVRDKIGQACAKTGRDPAEITLVGISKLKRPEEILSAVSAGLRHIGENRVEEGIEKIPLVQAAAEGELTWHMVGHVQSRKARQVARLFDVVQSVDSFRLAQRLSRLAGEREETLEIMLQVNVSGEASKYGFAGYNWYRDQGVRERLWQEMTDCLALPNLAVTGLMTMAPFNVAERVNRRVFADMRALRDELETTLECRMPVLSMGMTDDYLLAIEEGATVVRVGRAIFGERSQA